MPNGEPVLLGKAIVAGRLVHIVADGRLLPVLHGAAEGDPPPPPPTPQPDLAGLQAAIDAAKTEAQRDALATAVKALGFDKLDDAKAWVDDKRKAETDALSEVERRERAAEDRERAATEREAAAAATALRARVTAALVVAGAPAAHVNDLVPLVAVAPDADDAAITAAVEAKRAQFPALFTATPPPGGPPAPSGVPGGGPPPPPPNKGAMDKGRERYEARATKSKATSAA